MRQWSIVRWGLVGLGAFCLVGGISSAEAKPKLTAKLNVKSKRFTSPAAKWGWQIPPKFKTLKTKEKKRLRAGKVTVILKDLKNEKGKKMLVTLTRSIIKRPPKDVFKTMAQLSKAHKFMPRMFYSKVKKKLAPNVFYVIRKLKVAWVVVVMHMRVELRKPSRYLYSLIPGFKNGIKESIGAMTFEPINGGKHTMLTQCNYVDTGRWVPGFIRRPILRRDLPGVQRAIRKRTTSNQTWKKK